MKIQCHVYLLLLLFNIQLICIQPLLFSWRIHRALGFLSLFDIFSPKHNITSVSTNTSDISHITTDVSTNSSTNIAHGDLGIFINNTSYDNSMKHSEEVLDIHETDISFDNQTSSVIVSVEDDIIVNTNNTINSVLENGFADIHNNISNIIENGTVIICNNEIMNLSSANGTIDSQTLIHDNLHNKLSISNSTGVITTTRKFSENKYVAITFINGIFHTQDELQMIADDISTIFGINVDPFYNPSTGSWVHDATKAGIELFTRPSDLATVVGLTKHFRNILARLHPQGRILHIAHSGGAIVTYLSAKHHLSKEEKDRIDVVTCGGGRSITRKYFNGYLVNYYAKNDPCALLDQRAGNLLKRSSYSSIIIEPKHPWSYNSTSFWEVVKDMKHNTTFIFINAIANHPVLDHSMMGQPYRMALYHEANELRKRLFLMTRVAKRDRDLIRKLRKRVAKSTGLHHFWLNPQESLFKLLDTFVMDPKIYSVYEDIFSNIKIKYNAKFTQMSTAYQNMTLLTRNFIRLVRKKSANITGIHDYWN